MYFLWIDRLQLRIKTVGKLRSSFYHFFNIFISFFFLILIKKNQFSINLISELKKGKYKYIHINNTTKNFQNNKQMLLFKCYHFFFFLLLSRNFAAETLLSTLCPNDNLVYSSSTYLHNMVQLTTSKVLIAIACQSSGIYFEIRNDAKQTLIQHLITDISPSNGFFKVEAFKDGGFILAAFNTQTSLLVFQTYDASGVKVFTNSRVFPHSQTESTNGVWSMIVSKMTDSEYIVFAGHMTAVDGESFSYIIYHKDGSVQLSIRNEDLKKLNSINVAELMSTRFVFSYVRVRDDSTSTEFFYRIIKFDGTVVQGEERGTPSSLYSNFNRLHGVPIYYDLNEFAIVYGRNENNNNWNNDIFYMRYDLDGNYLTRRQLNTVRTNRNLESVRTLYPGSKKWNVSWSAGSQDGNGLGSYYTIMTGGSITVDETRTNTITEGDQNLQRITPLTLNTFAIVFTCFHSYSGSNFDTVVMTFNTDGVTIKTEISLNTQTNNLVKTNPVITLFENTKEILVIWKVGISTSSCKMYFNFAPFYCTSADSSCILEIPKIYPSKILLRNSLSTAITKKMINGEEGDKTIYSFSVSQVVDCHLGLFTSPATPISTFTMSDINSNKIVFVRTTNNPTLKLTVADSLETSTVFEIAFLIITPTMDLATFNIFKGNSIILTETQLNGTVYEDYVAIFTISNEVRCFFENIDSAGTPITSFSSTNLRANKIKFIHDNSDITPNFDINISDGIETSSFKSASITLKYLSLSFIKSLYLRSGATLDLTSEYLQFEGPDSFDFIYSTLTYLIIQKKTAPGIPLSSFTNTEFSQSQIQIVHDGSDNQPTLCLKTSDSINQSPSVCSTFKFVLKPKLLINQVRVVQGQILLVDENMIKGRVDDTLSILYRVKSTANCFLALSKNKNAPVTSFNKDHLISNQVFLVHDGSITAPNYGIEVYDGELTATLVPTINFFKIPIMSTNALNLIEGETIILNNARVDVQGSSFYNFKLTYYVTNVLNGYFDLSTNPSSVIIKFSDDDLSLQKVRFVHNTDSEPFYEISVKDDVGLSKTLSVSLKYTPKIKITKNSLALKRNENVIINIDNIDVTSLSDESSIVIYIEENKFCWFENINYPSVEIKSFTKKTLKVNLIKLFHDGSVNRPSFKIKASDGTQISKLIEAILAIIHRNSIRIACWKIANS